MFISTVAFVNVTFISLHLLSLLSMIRSQNYCTTRMPFDAVHGEMYTGNVFAVISMVGLQQCVSECISRKPNCKAVNYSRKQLSCEIFSSVVHSLPSDEYTKVNLEKAEGDSSCPLCAEGEKCVHLSNRAARCIEDGDYINITDCTVLHWRNSSLNSGKYDITILHEGKVRVFCEMEKDGGGWTVFQRRMDGSVDFVRTWNEYKNGFGNLSTEFWLGNKYLYNILRPGNFELRMHASDFERHSTTIKYESVSIGDETSKYRMRISGYSGNTGDCFTGENPIHDMKFTTWDQDNDNHKGNCASKFKGGWWYNACHVCNPNGLYLDGPNDQWAQGIVYLAWRGFNYSLKKIELMVRRTR